MRVEVMQYYGLTNPLTQAGYYETETHKQLTKDIRAAILEGRLIALCGVGCRLWKNGDTTTTSAASARGKPGDSGQVAVGGEKQH